MKIERWFQGSQTCSGSRRNDQASAWEGYGSQCLMTQATDERLSPTDIRRLGKIIDRHFSHRTTCPACQLSRDEGDGILPIIHFNNSPDTTREDIDKVLRVFTEEGQQDE